METATELIGKSKDRESVGKYTCGIAKKATTIVLGKDEDVITAAGANENTHDFVKDDTTLNVLRMINRSVFARKAPNDMPGTKCGSTIIAYLHIND